MNDFQGQVEGLRRRLRLQSLMSIGVLVILMFAMGGAETVARTLVESDAWRVKTRKVDLSYVDRLVATTDVNRAKIKVLNGNIQLEGETSLPNLTPTEEGTLGFDSTAKKLKYWNGTAWVDSSGGGGGGGTGGEETWRLEYYSINSIFLAGLGNGGGAININGTLYSYSTSPSLAPTGLTAGLVYRIYAYWNGSAVALEASTTAAVWEQYGRYTTKTDDPTRRFVGLCCPVTGPAFSKDMVRSVKNEQGYAYLYKHMPASAMNPQPQTSNTSWTDMDPVLNRTGLFFDQERIRAWASMMPNAGGQWVQRVNRLGVSVAGTAVDDSEVTGSPASGGYWAAANIPIRSEGYITIVGTGLKNVRPVHRSASGYSSVWYVDWATPASVGFEVLR